MLLDIDLLCRDKLSRNKRPCLPTGLNVAARKKKVREWCEEAGGREKEDLGQLTKYTEPKPPLPRTSKISNSGK
jgi:hypothetical protein